MGVSINTRQKYLKFSPTLDEARLWRLTLLLSPTAERKGVRGQQNGRDKFSGLDM
jgi:hypothetical protein